MANNYTYALNNRNMLGTAVDDLLGQRMAGVNPGQRASFKAQDEATATAVSNARANNLSTLGRAGGGMGVNLRRGVMAGDNMAMQQVAANKLAQAQQKQTADDTALAAGTARAGVQEDQQFRNLSAAGANAAAIGDTATSAALQDLFMEGAGQGYTAQAQAQRKSDAQRALDNEAWAKKYMESTSVPEASEGPWYKRLAKGALSGGLTAAGVSGGNPFATGGGAIVGSLANLFF